MDLKELAIEIREALKERRNNIGLSFVENKHIYYMRDINGNFTTKFPSASKIIKNFYKPFDAQGISLRMSKGDLEEQKRLLAEWKKAGRIQLIWVVGHIMKWKNLLLNNIMILKK